MTYWALNTVFLLPVVIVALSAFVRFRGAGRNTDEGKHTDDGGNREEGRSTDDVGTPVSAGSAAGVNWKAMAGTAVALLALTAVFDNLMISAGLFSYNPERISGMFIGRAPLEDFAYTIAAVVLLPSLWVLLTRRSRKGGRG